MAGLKEKIIKVKNNSVFIKGMLFSLFSFFNKGLNFLLLIVLAKFLTPEDYGELSLFITLVSLVGYVICLSSEGYAAVSFFKESESDYKGTISSVFVLPFIIMLLLCGTVAVLSLYTERLFDLEVSDVYYAIWVSFFTVYLNVCLDYFRVKENIFTYGKVSCSYSLLNFILTLVLIVSFQSGWHGRVFSLMGCSFMYFLFSLLVFIRDKRLSFAGVSFSTLKKVILWGIPLIPHLASTWIKQGGDRYIIKANYDMAEVGIFSFALNLVNIICMIGVAFNSSNSVDIYKSLSNYTSGTLARLRNYTKQMLWVYAVLSIVVLLVCIPLVLGLLSQYSTALFYFAWMIPYGYLQCVYFLYCNYLFYYGENKQIMNVTFFTSIIHLLLSFVLTRYSLYATAMVYSVTQLLIILLLRIKVTKVLKDKLPDYKVNWTL